MREINKVFLGQKILQGKTFVFLNDPRISAALSPTSYLARELKHLTENGYKIAREGRIYRATR
jgi:hypothetical protein